MILPIPNERPKLPPTVQIEKPDNFSSLDDAYKRLKESLERGDKSMYENVLQEFHTWCEVIQISYSSTTAHCPANTRLTPCSFS